IASANAYATDAGLQVLAEGGNAFDAAIAVSATLGLVEPESSGLGGGGFLLLHVAADGRDVFVDARERAPLAASRDMFLDENGQADRRRSVDGALAAGIPGMPAALEHLAVNYGRLPLSESLAPAIRLAREGWRFGPKTAALLGWRKQELAGDPGAAALFLVAGVRAAGGIWSEQDLAEYRVVEREPLRLHHRGWEIVTAPPPSSGGVALATILNILSGYDYAALPQAERVHLLTEAMRRAYHDRALYLGDPDFVQAPVDMLTSADYAAGLRAGIHPGKATP